MIRNNMVEHCYIHVPFCKSICYYCDFCHVQYNRDLVKEWLNALKDELNHYPINNHLKTTYIGGGTPTSLEDDLLKELLELIKPYTSNVDEYTIEINPETLTLSKVLLLKEYGINRVSIGIQAYQDHLLKMMNRKHTFEDVRNTVSLLKNNGITNIAVDIIYSLPTQTMDDLKETMEHVLDLKPSHVSIYSLQIEEGTVFYQKGIEPLNEDLEADMYDYLCDYLKEHGYEQYEISNFSLPDKQSKHNLAYWHYKDFYGFSCGASGKENHVRYDHTKNIKEYLKDPLYREEIPLTQKDEMFEMVMMSLRLVKGISKKEFQDKFNISIDEVYGKVNQQLIEQGLLIVDEESISCSEKGFPILNTILEYYLD